MGSTFVNIDPKKTQSTGIFKNLKPIPVYLQFVPGLVIQTITSTESAGFTGMRDINSIFAKSHISDDVEYNSISTTKYYPLFRGSVDVPIKGDQVLLCTFGGINYYLGPINTMNNPNFNIDHLNKSEYDYGAGKNNKSTYRDSLSLSKNFSVLSYPRMQKIYNDNLDDPNNNKKVLKDIHGDMLFEGRHGNSIRIGSRNVDPYIIISNERELSSVVESTKDGSIIGIFSKGTIWDHFPLDAKAEGDTIVKDQFILASDSIEEPDRFIGDENFNYEYSGNQIFQNSDKITINAKKDNLILSSINNIYIGSGNEIKIITNSSVTIESSNIFLGEQARKKKSDGDQAEPVVLGNQLKILLLEIIDILDNFKVNGTIGGFSATATPDVVSKLENLRNKLETPIFWSEYHFIEDNGQKS